MDILNGNAVHAVRGERSKYQPIRGSRVCGSSDPLDIISAVAPGEVYIADLDSIQRIGDNFPLIKKISEKAETMVDAGARDMNDVIKCTGLAHTVVLGTETASLELIKKAAGQFPGRINASIDIMHRRVLTGDMSAMKPQEIVNMLNEYDIKDVIALELDRVGTSTGIDADFLRGIASSSTHDVLVGGGIRDMNDIDALKDIGVSGALVATAVHNGKIPIELIG